MKSLSTTEKLKYILGRWARKGRSKPQQNPSKAPPAGNLLFSGDYDLFAGGGDTLYAFVLN